MILFVFSFSEIKSTMNELDVKYNHLIQVMESEKTAKWKLIEHCDDQAETITILRAEVSYHGLDVLLTMGWE